MGTRLFLRKSAWASLAASIFCFAIGSLLLRMLLCQAAGPNAFMASVILCSIACILFGVLAIRQKSWCAALGTLAVALLGGIMLVASMGLAAAGCSGV